MASVTLLLGDPNGQSAGNWVQWDERNAGYGDISVFANPEGESRHLIRLRIFRPDAQVQFQVIDTPDGSSGFGSSEELSDAWEEYSDAITVQASGVSPDLVISGPNDSRQLSAFDDEIEPYAWRNVNAINQREWFDAYETAGRPSVTIIVADSEPSLMLTLPSVDDQTLVVLVDLSLILPEGMDGNIPLTYSLSGLPPGLFFNPSSREITGNTSTVGQYPVTYTVTDADDNTATHTFTFTVTAESPNIVVVIPSIVYNYSVAMAEPIIRQETVSIPNIQYSYSVTIQEPTINVFDPVVVEIPGVIYNYSVLIQEPTINDVPDNLVVVISGIVYSYSVTVQDPTTNNVADNIAVDIPGISYSYSVIINAPTILEAIPVDVIIPDIDYSYRVSIQTPAIAITNVKKFDNDYSINLNNINDVVESMFDSIPVLYSDSEVLQNIFNAIKPELDALYLVVSAYDKSILNKNEKINNELDIILNGIDENSNVVHIGYGHEKIIYQNYLISANRFLEDYARFLGANYNESGIRDYTEIRLQLLFKSRSREFLSNQDLIDELDFIFTGAIESIDNTYANYDVDISLNSNAPTEITGLAQEKIRQTIPAHLTYSFVSTEPLTLSKEPQGTLSDLVDYVLGR